MFIFLSLIKSGADETFEAHFNVTATRLDEKNCVWKNQDKTMLVKSECYIFIMIFLTSFHILDKIDPTVNFLRFI